MDVGPKDDAGATAIMGLTTAKRRRRSRSKEGKEEVVLCKGRTRVDACEACGIEREMSVGGV
jgi:hypothetical protein